ncbi:hypothetical protein [Nocardia sp. CC227C]|uniref:hypothetical protein n=1 Tax=Nocardia sp. CC227C TaxID=3044562 RepID=UPI00278BE39D|nr:hypothetical protein [Nocardia sp. CC227C]
MYAAAAAALCTGCGITGSAVLEAGDAPTGIAPGVTLYFVGAGGDLVPQARPTGSLGGIPGALDLLSRIPNPGDGLYSEVPWSDSGPMSSVTEFDDRITIRMPVPRAELTDLAVSQIACTALGVHRQAGRPPATVVIIPTHGAEIGPVGCPAQS